ncbi:hypothetical protein PHLGIDRAFT_479671 [Phlebiopsis gigantea 11061_1 CR5-6]|uniref:Uncharacterized protein n=1 Tax=Phlebiopsis gigantea (strain 11061_1 CR5-6) TaxID=745531 RepID=A0A0C3NLP9_PHLG1|nr:hypothetical protein PHLGIDRAFT_479671 [Phlebiopsis gigantea 11061_1 CR5-6]
MQQVDYIPTSYRKCPPTKLLPQNDGYKTYSWFITEDEYLRLCSLFGREFQECNLGATLVNGLPTPCKSCGKHTEFIDWVWTALRRGVHTADFMFEALKDRRMPKENMHDVYCSQCGTLTMGRSRNNAEGGAPHISEAGKLHSADYPARKPQANGRDSPSSDVSEQEVC